MTISSSDKERAEVNGGNNEEKQAEAALRESEERFRMLGENMSQLAWTCDLLGNVTWYNKRWLDYTGLSFEDMQGWGWTKVQHPDHVDRVIARVRQSGETGEPWEDTFPLRGKDGNYRWFLSRALPIRDEQGNLVQWFGTNTDVTAQKIAEEQVARQADELRALNARLQELDRAKTVFFSNVSHEFRTPLTLILGPTEELLSGSLDDNAEVRRAHLSTLRNNALRLQKLVNTMLDFARVEAGRMEASYEPVDLGLLTRDLASTFCSAIHRAGLLFIMNCPSLEEPVYIDRDMWEKIVLNLLSNALKFTLKGTIEIAIEDSGSSVRLIVRDTGGGIPRAELPRLFDRFHRVPGGPSRTQEGSGIGLALVHELVRQHGGSISVDSELGQGTIFSVHIPKGAAHLPAERLSRPRNLSSTALGAAPYIEEALSWLPGADPAEVLPAIRSADLVDERLLTQTRSERILIADDNLEMRNYLKRLLETRWHVSAAADGATALEIARTERPDLVLSDAMMPRLSGFELLRKLREDENTSTIPVILLSARAGEESYIEGMSAGADDYIVKPFGARELLARVNALLEVTRVRRESERTLRESEARYRRLLALLPMAVYTCEAPSGAITYYNEHAALLWGRAPDLGDTDERFCGSFRLSRPDGTALAHNETPMAAAIRDGLQFRNQEVVIERLDGKRIHVLVNIDPIHDDSGRVVGAINVFYDTTGLKQAEAELRRSEERFRRMADSSPILIWMTDDSGKTQFLNKTSLDYCGIVASQAADFDWTQIVHPEERAAYAGAFQSALQQRRTFYQRARLRRFDGVWRWFESRANPIIDETGSLIAFIGSSADISDIYESQQALRELGQRKDEFLANMSHEIRSPLTGIMGYADILLTRLKDPDDIECLRTIKESGDYLVEIVNDILDLSKIEAGKLVLTIEAVAIHSLLSEVQQLMAIRAKQKKLPLGLRYESSLPETVQSDRTRLRQILINLVSNGIKFTEQGRVDIIARIKERKLELEVADTGIGIAPEHQLILFQPFTQADTSSTRQYGGTGLGLTITKRLAEMLGGEISFTSAPGRGSTFRVAIPLGEGVAEAPPKRRLPALSVVQPTASVLRGKRVLVVDDREEICYLVSRYIREAGGRPDEATDGESALQAIACAGAAEPFDAVILDIHMPGMDGYEVVRTLRARGFARPIIALTAGAMVGDREKCLQAGFDDYLTKPIDRARLVELVAQLAARAAASLNGVSEGRRVLLVDDSHNTCKFLTLFLEKRGYHVRSAHDGETALAAASEFKPGVVIMDIGLPDMDGFQLLRRMKDLDAIVGARYIGLSGYRNADAPGFGEFDHFLEKPVDTTHLHNLLREFAP